MGGVQGYNEWCYYVRILKVKFGKLSSIMNHTYLVKYIVLLR